MKGEQCISMIMMTSSNGNIFRVTSHMCAEFTGPGWIPLTKACDVFFYMCLIHGWIKNHEAGDLRRRRAHYDAIAILSQSVLLDPTLCCVHIIMVHFDFINLNVYFLYLHILQSATSIIIDMGSKKLKQFKTTSWREMLFTLTHWGLVTSCGDIDLGQPCFSQRLCNISL